MDLAELARSLNALEKVDVSRFQRRARVLQSIWREENGIPCGEHRRNTSTRPLGSRLPMPWAKESLANFLTPTIRDVVRLEVLDAERSRGKLFGQPRIFNDLLSSQPLCFNLFGELRSDLSLASHVIGALTEGRFPEVVEVSFEHSPGRGDSRYSSDRSAFDVFLTCRTRRGGVGFVAIEVKYHENLLGPPAEHRTRYDDIAHQMRCFDSNTLHVLRRAPLQQIWRDHLLAGVTRIVDALDDALFVVLYPTDNEHCRDAIAGYRSCLTESVSFAAWTIEEFVARLRLHSSAAWLDLFTDRYLAFQKVDRRLG